ncbi:MAG: hypothetical protein ACQKBY_08950 [Verrucomicrobiales bacterium]
MSKRHLLFLRSYLSFSLCLGSAAAATTYTFDDQSLGRTSSSSNTYEVYDLVFSAVSGTAQDVNFEITNLGLIAGGSDHALAIGLDNEINTVQSVSIKMQDDSHFKLSSLVLGDILGNADIRIEAYLDGAKVTAYGEEDRDILSTSVEVTFTGWDDLDEIRITNYSSPSDLQFDLDDLTLAAPVPEPQGVLLLCISAYGLFCRRQR